MKIPPTDYGYWIDPDGTFHSIDDSEKHVGFAGRVLGKPPGGEGPLNNDHRIELLNLGWTRVAVHSRRFVVQLPPCSVSPTTLLGLNELIWRFHREAVQPIHVRDPFTELDAGGKTVRPGDPAVLATWRAICKRRGVTLPRGSKPVKQ